jgi:hypothetical protein
MRQVRFGVFETNSSSTHSICICTAEDFKQFKRGNLAYDGYQHMLVPADDVIEEIDSLWGHRYKSYERYNVILDEYLDRFQEEFTTPSGDEMVAFGYYGYI